MPMQELRAIVAFHYFPFNLINMVSDVLQNYYIYYTNPRFLSLPTLLKITLAFSYHRLYVEAYQLLETSCTWAIQGMAKPSLKQKKNN